MDCINVKITTEYGDSTDRKYYIQAEDHRYSVAFILLAMLADLYASCVKNAFKLHLVLIF